MIKEGSIRNLIDAHDQSGYLSLYLNVNPEEANKANTKLNQMLLSLNLDKGSVNPILLEEFSSPANPGRGRVIFVPLSGSEPWTWHTQLPGPNLAVLNPKPYVLSLLRMMQFGKPAGYIELHNTKAHICHWNDGVCHNLGEESFDIDDLNWRQYRNVSGLNGIVSANRENYQRRLDTWRDRKLDEFKILIQELAQEYSWSNILICGPPEFRSELSFRDDVIYKPFIGQLTQAQINDIFLEARQSNLEAEVSHLQSLNGRVSFDQKEIDLLLEEGRIEHLYISQHIPQAADLVQKAFGVSSQVSVCDQELDIAATLRW